MTSTVDKTNELEKVTGPLEGIKGYDAEVSYLVLLTCKRLGCVHHRSLPTRKSKNRNIGRIQY